MSGGYHELRTVITVKLTCLCKIRRYDIAIYQRGVELGIVVAEYTASWMSTPRTAKTQLCRQRRPHALV